MMPVHTTLETRCPAKINLTLRVVGQRPDGYHDIESLVALVDFCDELSISTHEDGAYALSCDDPALPTDGSNLVLRAARALARAGGVNLGAAFGLRKRIPAGAGLGGGSSNAASTFALLNVLWRQGRSHAELMAMAALVGSDAPLFLAGPLSVIRGRGEIVEPLAGRLSAWCVLILPPFGCSTPAVYRAFDAAQQRRAASPPPAAAATRSAVELMPRLFNDLEAPAFAVEPRLAALAARAREIVGGPVRMSGSGSALFTLVDERAQAEALAGRLRGALGVRVEAAAFLP